MCSPWCNGVEGNELLLFCAKPRQVPGRSHRGEPHLLDKLLSKDTTCMLCHTCEGRGGNEGDNTESLKSDRPEVFSDNYLSFSFLRPYLFSKTYLISSATSSKKPSGFFSGPIFCDCLRIDKVLTIPNCFQFSKFITVHSPTNILLPNLFCLSRFPVSPFLIWLTPTHDQNST